MRHANKKTFFDNDIVINEKLFENFQITNIVSWSHLELWCAINNIELTYAFFKGILCGSVIISKLYSIILDAINTTNFLDAHINNVETIEIIEKIYSNNVVYSCYDIWQKIITNQKYFEDEETDEHTNYKKYNLLTSIFIKNPYVILKFYDIHKISLHLYDNVFITWLLKISEQLKNKNKLNINVYNALLSEVKKSRNIVMYLN